MTSLSDAPRTLPPPPQKSVIGTALVLAVTLSVGAGVVGGGRQAALGLIGILAGFALFKASFDFTGAWRRALTERRTAGLRAQLIMIGLTILVFFPMISAGSFLDRPVEGLFFPIGLALAVGSFLFGVGMQLGGGCGSGTLFTAGSGNTRMWVTLVAFIVGSFAATADPLGWSQWPSFAPVSLTEELGLPSALATATGTLGFCYLACIAIERARHRTIEPLEQRPRAGGWFAGGWPILAGAVALALVNIATLLVAGRPWGITSAFALWGAKNAAFAGLDPSEWRYWQGHVALEASVLSDPTSVMNFGIMIGSLLAVGIAGGFTLNRRTPPLSLIAAILGGLLMGVGARLSTGCNIGAFFSGTASGSLHGIVWLVFAIPGNAIGIRLRSAFGLQA